ncbi:MAG TPA: GAF domain-containing sensor histidine kinase [Anaerolineae bacterium]|nr:GAF domain-containing sensor histidine kinase [Anaerolineae bacterium]
MSGLLKYLDTSSQDGESNSNLIEEYQEKIANLERKVDYLEQIVEISQILNSTLELDALLRSITQVATELTDTEACSILLYDKEANELRFMPSTVSASAEKLLEVPVPLDNSIAGWVFRKKKPILIRDAKNDPRWNSNVDETSDFDTCSILGVPLKIKREVIGVMEVLNKKGEYGFNQDDIQITTILAAQVAVAIENARLWDDIQKAYKELTELDRLKSEFVSIASHELKTPLSVILGYASFLRDQVSGEATEQLDMVLSSAMKLRSLIDDMVNLRHVHNDDIQLDVEIFSMRKLVEDVLAEFQNLIKAKLLKVKLQLDKGDDPVDIEGDRQKLRLVVANLLSNAIKFTPDGGGILLGLGREGQKIYLRVADTGIGIAEDQFDKIFEDFYQVEPSLTRRFEGLGLGLPIAKGMVETHNGSVMVESVPGKGSQFTVILPISVYL